MGSIFYLFYHGWSWSYNTLLGVPIQSLVQNGENKLRRADISVGNRGASIGGCIGTAGGALPALSSVKIRIAPWKCGTRKLWYQISDLGCQISFFYYNKGDVIMVTSEYEFHVRGCVGSYLGFIGHNGFVCVATTARAVSAAVSRARPGC